MPTSVQLREAEIRGWVRALLEVIGDPKPFVDTAEVTRLYEARSHLGMFTCLRERFALDCQMQFLVSDSGAPRGAVAWMRGAREVPRLGTPEFREYRVTCYLHPIFAKRSLCDELTIAIVRELSRLYLRSIRHELKRVPEAVDLTAMFYGYRAVYRRYADDEGTRPKPSTLHPDILRALFGEAGPTLQTYLSAQEVRHALALMRT